MQPKEVPSNDLGLGIHLPSTASAQTEQIIEVSRSRVKLAGERNGEFAQIYKTFALEIYKGIAWFENLSGFQSFALSLCQKYCNSYFA